MASAFGSSRAPRAPAASVRRRAPTRIAFPGAGCLELDPEARLLVFEARTGERTPFDDHPIFEEPGRLRHAVHPEGRSVLLAREAGDRLHLFDRARVAFRTLPCFERLRRSEATSLYADPGGFLVVTENGIAALDPDGAERWRIAQITHGWRLLDRARGCYWLEDSGGNIVAIDAATGAEHLT